MLSQNDLEYICNKILKENSDLSYEEIYEEVKEYVNKDRYLLFEEQGQINLFITWLEYNRNNRLHIYIYNGFIDKGVNRNFNLCKLREFFRSRYPNAYFYYWFSKKRDKFVYCK